MASDEVPNIYAYRGRNLLSAYNELYADVPNCDFPELEPIFKNQKATPDRPVCIIGAGMAALYTAMILESLKISYHIVDGNTRERIGGRIFTYRFPNGGPYDYYEVGAMRFLDTSFMRRTFDLIKNRGLNIKLIPYIMQIVDPPSTFLYYNGCRVKNQAPSTSSDPFDIKEYIADLNLKTPEGVSAMVSGVVQPFRDYFRPVSGKTPDIGTAMERLFKKTNKFSMRSYMSEKGMTGKAINWCETLDDSTGSYDQALTEVVIGSLALNWPTTPLPGPEEKKNANEGWFCLDGGFSTLPEAMFASLSKEAQDAALFNSSVTAISRDHRPDVMRISVNGVKSEREYSAVISTVPLSCLSHIDLTRAGIHNNYAQWSAIRELQYAPAIKIGIKFKSAWWSQSKLLQPIRGGQSYTDLPLRTIVYPSYPKDEKPGEICKVLIASYCWNQDAQRLGVLMNGDGTAKPKLIEMMFRDLAAIHGVTVEWLKEFYTDGDYFAWDWNNDPLTMGGSAFFGPGSYGDGDIRNEMLQPAANGKLFFAGEATSACHSWVAGALDSAWRAVDQYLLFNYPRDVREIFWEKWGATEYLDEALNKKLVDLNHELSRRHLMISLYNSRLV